MRNAPNLLVVIGSKQAIVNRMADLNDGAGDAFSKTLLVAYLREERGRTYEYDLGT